MRLIVTGADGFVGRALRRLATHHDVVATDRAIADGIAGDLTDPALLDRLFATRADAVIHLATIPGGAAEADPARAWAINVEATRRLADAAAAAGCRRFVHASSVAVFGELPCDRSVDDATPLAPRLLYAAHKAMIETWLATLDRRGALCPIALRLPGLVARPADGAGLKSAFMSEVFHAIAAGRALTLPVSPGATMWLMSASRAAANLLHAAEAQATGALTLPALRVAMADLVAAIARHTGRAPRIDHAPDPALEAAFGALPPLATPAADALGFAHDGDLAGLVAAAFGDAR